MMGTGAGFHRYPARWQVGKGYQQLAARDGLLQYNLAMRIDAMHTEGILCQVDPYGRNIHDGLYFFSIDRNTTLQSGASDAVRGGEVYFIR